MKTMTAVFAIATLGTIAVAAFPILADDTADSTPKPTKTFVEMAQANPDGKISKRQVMGMMEKSFDRVDTRKEGKLDEWQARQFQIFLREFTRESGG
jgi:hypothetical protein